MNTQQVLEQLEKFFKEKVRNLIQEFNDEGVEVFTNYIKKFPTEISTLQNFLEDNKDSKITDCLCIQINHSGIQDIILVKVDKIAKSIVHMDLVIGGESNAWVSEVRESFSFDNNEVDFLSGRNIGIVGNYILQSCFYNTIFKTVPSLSYLIQPGSGLSEDIKDELRYCLSSLNGESIEILNVSHNWTNTKPGTRKYRQSLDFWIEGNYGDDMNLFKTKKLKLSLKEESNKVSLVFSGGNYIDEIVENSNQLLSFLIQIIKERLDGQE